MATLILISNVGINLIRLHQVRSSMVVVVNKNTISHFLHMYDYTQKFWKQQFLFLNVLDKESIVISTSGV